MKKIILMITVIAFMFVTNIKAQDSKKDFRDKVNFGLKVGLNNSNVYDTKGDNFVATSKLGFAGGAFISIPLGTFIGIQPEVLYSQKGFKSTGTVLGSSYTFTRTLNYLDIPIFFTLKPIECLTLLVGPQYSYLISQKDVFTSSTTNYTLIQNFTNNNVRKNVLAFVVGADVTVKHFVIGARLGWDIQDNNGDGTSTNPRYKNVWEQLTVGFRF